MENSFTFLAFSEALKTVLGLRDVEFTMGKQNQDSLTREATQKLQNRV